MQFRMPRPLESTLFPYTTLFRSRTLRPLLGETLSLPRDANAHPRRGRRLLHRRPHRSPRARSAADAVDDVLASDRKSTRLNSSHVSNSYAVFCLKTKNALPSTWR